MSAPKPKLIDDLQRRSDLDLLKVWASRGPASAKHLRFLLITFGWREMRRLGLGPPPAKPSPYNPSGLIIGGRGGASTWSEDEL